MIHFTQLPLKSRHRFKPYGQQNGVFNIACIPARGLEVGLIVYLGMLSLGIYL